MLPTTFICLLTQAASTIAAIYLGAADTFGVLSGQSITNAGNTAVNSDIGTAGVSITGFPPGIYLGTEYLGNLATPALNDAITAYDSIKALTGGIPLSGDLGGMFLVPGTYSFTSTAALTGNLVLVGTGSAKDAWYFQIGSTLTTAAYSSVILTRGAQPCMIFWQLGTSATFGAGSYFTGAVLAAASITMGSRAVSNGGLFALAGTVTMDANVVNVDTCPAPVVLASSSTVLVVSTVVASGVSSIFGTTSTGDFSGSASFEATSTFAITSSVNLVASTTASILSSITTTSNPSIGTSSYVLPTPSVTSVYDTSSLSMLPTIPGVISSSDMFPSPSDFVTLSSGGGSISTTLPVVPDLSSSVTVPTVSVPTLSESISLSTLLASSTTTSPGMLSSDSLFLSTTTSGSLVVSTSIIQPLVTSTVLPPSSSIESSSSFSSFSPSYSPLPSSSQSPFISSSLKTSFIASSSLSASRSSSTTSSTKASTSLTSSKLSSSSSSSRLSTSISSFKTTASSNRTTSFGQSTSRRSSSTLITRSTQYLNSTIATSTRSGTGGGGGGIGMCDATCVPTRVVFTTSRVCRSTDTVVTTKTVTVKSTITLLVTKIKNVVACTAPAIVPRAEENLWREGLDQ